MEANIRSLFLKAFSDTQVKTINKASNQSFEI